MRTEIPHERYDEVQPWPYNINWTGGSSSWFENLNYTDLPLNMSPPSDILQQLENVVFLAAPQDPPQLWRSTAYNRYDGSSWSKTINSPVPATSEIISRSQALAQGNPIYTIYLNLTAGPSVGSVELPTLFPTIQVIEDSFQTGQMVSGSFQADSPSRLLDMRLDTDVYGTLLLSPLLEGPTGTSILLAYEVTYRTQDLANVANNALEGQYTPSGISSMYGSLAGVTLTQAVLDEIAPFEIPGMNAYDTALTVSLSFRSKYLLMMGPSEFMERPAAGQEVTDWFIQRGGGLPMDFATAYCVFMRHLNISARVTIGYAVGDPSGDYRTVRVRHMMFWAEVFVPMSGSPTGGEWIQVIPIPLPGSMGGGEVPQNTDPGNIQLYVWPSQVVTIGDNFNLSAVLLFQGLPVSTPELIYFRDETDMMSMGTATIQMGTYLPLANITYAFPAGSTLGFHTISATWFGSTFSVTNYTVVDAMDTPDPLISSRPRYLSDFSPSEIVDMNIKLHLGNYTAHWQDTIRAHGIMTVSGVPVNGSTLNNNQMQIMWDDAWIGNATIGDDGYYELNITVNPNDLVRMKIGLHTVLAEYAGEPGKLYPSRSQYSNVTVWGIVGFSLTVRPQNAYRGFVLVYDGIAQLLNGTRLVSKTIGIFLNGTLVNTAITNSSGGFRSTYTIPSDYPIGVAYARVNWSSTMSLVSGNWSNPIAINILAGGTLLSINSTPRAPQVVHIYESILIYGYLVHAINGSGIQGQTIEVWWQNGTSTVLIGSNVTDSGGYYTLSYALPAGYEGNVTHWTQFNSPGLPLVSSRSVNMTIRVQKWEVQVSIQVDRNPVHLLETVTVSGNVTLPEIPAYLGNVRVTIWWSNSTGLYNLTVVLTSPATFLYTYSIPISLYHGLGTVTLWSEFVSPDPSIASNESVRLSLQIINYDTILTVFSNGTSYHLNETVHIWGRLRFENGSPWPGRTVNIYWNNGSIRTFYSTTNSTGWYNFYYNCSIPKDSPGTVGVQVRFTSPTRLYDNATAVLSPSLTLRLYQITVNVNPIAAQYHLNETIVLSGNLTFQEGGAALAGANVTIYYRNSTSTYLFFKTTDGSGSFTFRYNCSIRDALGAVYIWARYTSWNPLWSNGQSANRTTILILYQLVLNATATSPVTMDQAVIIRGNLTYAGGGPPVANAPVRVYLRVGPSWFLVYDDFTDSFGAFVYSHRFSVPPNVPGLYLFKCNCTRISQLTTNATTQVQVNAQAIQVVVTVNAGGSTTYLGVSFVVSGRLEFQNGTEMVGYTVRLDWDQGFLNMATSTVEEGNFTFNFNIPWSQQPGQVSYVVIFQPPSAAFGTANSSVLQVDVYDLVQLHLGPQSVFVAVVTEMFTVSGFVTDGGGRVSGVPLQITVDSLTMWGSVSTVGDGTFSIALTVPSNWSLGSHVVSLSIAYGYYEVDGTPDFWSVEVHMGSIITIALVEPRDVMPGETFNFTLQLEDSTGAPLTGFVSIYLNDTFVATQIVSGSITTTQTVPVDWTSGSGIFILSARYSGAGFVDGCVGETTNSIHVFTRNVQFQHETGSRIDPGSSLTIRCRLTDDSARHLPIVGRLVRLYLNGTGNSTTRTTGADGRISYTVTQDAPQGYYEYSITLVSSVYAVDSGIYRVEIQPASGLPLPVVLLLFWTATIMIEVVAAYLVIRRYRPRFPRMTRHSRHRLYVGLSITRSKQVMTNASTY